jgi:hypothetical protein
MLPGSRALCQPFNWEDPEVRFCFRATCSLEARKRALFAAILLLFERCWTMLDHVGPCWMFRQGGLVRGGGPIIRAHMTISCMRVRCPFLHAVTASAGISCTVGGRRRQPISEGDGAPHPISGLSGWVPHFLLGISGWHGSLTGSQRCVLFAFPSEGVKCPGPCIDLLRQGKAGQGRTGQVFYFQQERHGESVA